MTEDEGYYAAFERFCIASESGDDITALKVVQAEFGRPVAVRIWREWVKDGGQGKPRRGVQNRKGDGYDR